MGDEPKEPILEIDAETGTTQGRDGFNDSLTEALKAIGVGPIQSTTDALEKLDVTRDVLSDVARRAAEQLRRAGAFLPPPRGTPNLAVIPYRDPDAATRQVVDEIRELAQISAAMAQAASINADLAKASLEQTAALVAAVGSLHRTTRQGIEAGGVRDAAAERREGVIVGLTMALVALTAVLAVPEIRHLWSDLDPWRTGIANWIQSLVGR